jgi:ribonuclease J
VCDSDAETDGQLRLIPLGGLGEFGLNSLVVEWGGDRLLVDAGAMFPSAEMPGVDSVVPDFAYLEGRGTLHAVVLTHGHEDHIGALSFALQAAQAPVYATALTLGFARRRLVERGVDADLRSLVPGQPVEAGPFRIHPIRVAHSVSDSVCLAIETPAGTIVLTGDYKIGADLPAEEQTDLHALEAWGDRGVLALLADSTNIEVRGFTPGEGAVEPAFEEVLARTPGRVLVSCFATAIPRLQRVADLAIRAGRRLAFVGRRMADNADIAIDLGRLRIPPDSIVASNRIAEHPRERVLAFVAGSQGEPFSAMSLVSVGEQRDLAVGPGDVVVFSARAIPGNERAVSRVMSNLYRRGCDVLHPGVARVHVSGHGSREDLATMIRAVRPRYFVPVHGEYRMLAQHARLAVEAGVPAHRIRVAENGDVLAFDADGLRRGERVHAGRTLLDRSGIEELDEMVVRDRRHLAFDGIVVPVVAVDKQTGRVEFPPEIVSRGFVDEEGSTDLLAEAREVVVRAVESRPEEERFEPALIRDRIRADLRRLLRRRTQRRPMVIPVVLEV